MKPKTNEFVNFFIDSTTILALLFVMIQCLRMGQNLITPVKALITGLVACAYMAIAVYTSWCINREN